MEVSPLPKDTFFNLPSEKRDRIVDLALDEFALYDYRAASLTRIVENAGIAKGSMYQYFEDKKDLYLYVVNLAAEEKFNFINQSISEVGAKNFFDKYRLICFYGARFDFSQPRYANILYHVTYEPYDTDIREISAQLKATSYQFIESSVEEGIQNGDLRDDLSPDFVVFALYQLTVALRDYLSQKFNFSFKKAVEVGRGSPVRDDDLAEVLEEFIDFFREGLEATDRLG